VRETVAVETLARLAMSRMSTRPLASFPFAAQSTRYLGAVPARGASSLLSPSECGFWREGAENDLQSLHRDGKRLLRLILMGLGRPPAFDDSFQFCDHKVAQKL
jgi:hypothetical protein